MVVIQTKEEVKLGNIKLFLSKEIYHNIHPSF